MRYCLQKKHEIQGPIGQCKWDPADTFVWTGHQLSHTRAQRSFQRAVTPGTEQGWAVSLGPQDGPGALSKSSVTLALTEYRPRGTRANPAKLQIRSQVKKGKLITALSASYLKGCTRSLDNVKGLRKLEC